MSGDRMESGERTRPEETVLEDNRKNNETEEAKICLMRTVVGKQDPSSKELDDLTISRFLRARDLDIEKASAMLLRFLKWRKAFVPNGSISPSETPSEIAQNKMFLQGIDKKGRPIAVLLGARHFQNRGGLDEFKLVIGYVGTYIPNKDVPETDICLIDTYDVDPCLCRIPAGQEKFVAIGDLEGWGYANTDIRGYIGALSILQDYYPERLGKLFIVNAPYIFMAVWKIVYPFIDNKTKKKIEFVEAKKMKSTLLEYIDESQIPERYGGKLPLVPIHES